MPALLFGNTNWGQGLDEELLHGGRISYKYPKGLDLKPGSETHRKLLDKIRRRVQRSREAMGNHYSSWNRVDKVMRIHARPDWQKRATEKGSDKKKDTPLFTMPLSLATRETLLVYMTSAFLQKTPIFQYEGGGPEDVYKALIAEEVIQSQVVRNTVGLNLHTQYSDSFTYGIGVSQPRWNREFGWRMQEKETGFVSRLTGLFVNTPPVKEKVWGMTYEGNALENIDVYRYFPDTNVPLHEPQKGEFNSWVTSENYASLLILEKEDADNFFNVRYLKNSSPSSSLLSGSIRPEGVSEEKTNHSSQIDVLWFYCNLIPKDWGLGSSEYPEKWLFAVGADKVILSARQMDFTHNLFPVTVAAPDYDGHSAVPMSRMESINSLQTFVDFLHTSHITNIRKVLNDMFVVDPSLVNIYDLENPEPGKIIRMRRSQWGRGGLDQAIKQLQVSDVTGNNVNEAAFMANMAQEFAGAGDTLRGELAHRGPRISSTQAQGARSAGFSKMERLAMIIDMQTMQPMGRMFVSHMQQFMEEDTFVKVTGNRLKDFEKWYGSTSAGERVEVSPFDLLGEYDIVPSSGTVAGSQDPQTWIQLFQIALGSQNQEILNSLDFPKVFTHIASQLGAKNIGDFLKSPTSSIPPQVVPDEQVENQVQQGNLLPI